MDANRIVAAATAQAGDKADVMPTRLARGLAAIVAAAAVLATLLVAPSPAHAGSAAWRMAGYNAANSRLNPAETIITDKSIRRLRHRWSIVTPQVPDSCSRQVPPVVAAGRLFLPDQGGVAAYDAATGRQLWSYRYPSPLDELPPLLAVVGGRLFVATTYCQSLSNPFGTLRALDAATGAPLWHQHTNAPVDVLLVDRGMAVISGQDFSGDAATTAFRAADGSLAWARSGQMLAQPVSAGGRLLLYGWHDPETRTMVDIVTGSPLWTTTASWLPAAAAPDGNRLYVSWSDTSGSGLSAVDPATGAVAWSAPHTAVIATSQQWVYCRISGNRLAVLRASDGAPVRIADTTYDQPLREVIAGNLIYGLPPTTYSPGHLVITRATDGRTIPVPKLPAATGHAVVVDGRLYLTDGTTLQMFSPGATP